MIYGPFMKVHGNDRPSGVSMFFPAYNDGGTIASLVIQAVKKFHDFGFRVAEVPVHHYHRAYGKSQFFNFPRLVRTAIDVARLWVALVGPVSAMKSPIMSTVVRP